MHLDGSTYSLIKYTCITRIRIVSAPPRNVLFPFARASRKQYSNWLAQGRISQTGGLRHAPFLRGFRLNLQVRYFHSSLSLSVPIEALRGWQWKRCCRDCSRSHQAYEPYNSMCTPMNVSLHNEEETSSIRLPVELLPSPTSISLFSYLRLRYYLFYCEYFVSGTIHPYESDF